MKKISKAIQKWTKMPKDIQEAFGISTRESGLEIDLGCINLLIIYEFTELDEFLGQHVRQVEIGLART